MNMPAGPSSFDTAQRMGGGHGGGNQIGIMKSFLGMEMDQKFSSNVESEKVIQVTGFSGIKGLGEMLCDARGQGFFACLFDALASREEAFGGDHGGPRHATSGGEGGGGESGGNHGSNRPFSGIPPMDHMGPMSHVPPHMLGRLTPSPTPGQGHGMGMGMGGGHGGGMGM